MSLNLKSIPLLLAAAAAAVACGGQPTPSAPPVAPPRQPWAAFSKESLRITALEAPQALPLLPGSNTDGTIASSDSAIAQVDASGRVVAHRRGVAELRTTSGSRLQVEVTAPVNLRPAVSKVELRTGESAPLKLLGDDGPFDATGLDWSTTAPGTAVVENGLIKAGRMPGEAILTASAGGKSVSVTVAVRGNRVSFELRSAQAALKQGALGHVDFIGDAAAPVTWSSSNSTVLRVLAGGIIQAVAPGRANICAESSSIKKCVSVRVI